MLNIVLFGPPGAGKGTQAARLIEKYGFHHISTGEVIREEIRQGSPLGLSVKGFIDKGQLAPDALVIDLIADYVSKHKESKGNIFVPSAARSIRCLKSRMRRLSVSGSCLLIFDAVIQNRVRACSLKICERRL